MLFEGLAFLLTCSSEGNKTRKNRSGTSHLEISDPETSDEEEEDSLANLPAFDKNRLVEQIEKSGGIWVNSFEEAQIVQLEQVFLIADTYLETYKYIQSIAAGIPCVSHVWVDNCCSTNSLLDYHSYLLPTGYSVIEKKLIEWHFQTSIFERCRVLLVFANDRSSITNWIVALLAAKSEVVQCLTELEDRSGIFHTDVIVTDSSCPDYVVKAAHQITIPLVSTEWIVQCIINGCIVPFESHPHFNFKYQDMSSEV
ncbi:TP53-binding protein 1-like [Tachypleus tridentatus]